MACKALYFVAELQKPMYSVILFKESSNGRDSLSSLW